MLDKKSTAANQPIKRQNQIKRNRFICTSVEQQQKWAHTYRVHSLKLYWSWHIYAPAPMSSTVSMFTFVLEVNGVTCVWRVWYLLEKFDLTETEIACKSHEAHTHTLCALAELKISTISMVHSFRLVGVSRL